MAPYLNPFRLFASWRGSDAAKLYGAIVAQARLPVFYQSLGVPDRVDGRFLVLSINLFAVLHRLKEGGPEAHRLGQALSDRFSADMETVLRELGVGDLAIPKQMRALAASSRTLLQAYADASARGEEALAAEITNAFPFLRGGSKDATSQLAHYLMVARPDATRAAFAGRRHQGRYKRRGRGNAGRDVFYCADVGSPRS